jgi:hypothetical protein
MQNSSISQFRGHDFPYNGGWMKMPNADGPLPTFWIVVITLLVAVAMIDTLPSPWFAT